MKNYPFKIFFLLVVTFLILFSNPLFSQKTTVYDTPTALTLEQGEYHFSSFLSGNAILLKYGVGAHKIINFGITEYINNLIGVGDVSLEIPNAFVKIRFTDLPDDSHNVAFGFDSFYNGALSPFNQKIYGVYLVYTYGFNFDNEYISGPQLLSFGIRYPIIYESGEVNIFGSLYFNLFEHFNLGFEVSNIHFARQFGYHFILSNILTFKPSEEFSIDLNFQLGMKTDGSNKFDFSREVRISYQNFF